MRKYIGKAQVTVLDFIGNFRRAHILPILLSGKNPMAMTRNEKSIIEMDYPEGCNVQFDMKLIDLFEQLKKNEKLSTRIENEYFRLRGQLDHRPTRTDIFEGSDIKASEFFKLKMGHLVLKGYLALLSHLGELQEEEIGWIGTEAENFLYEIETMSMSKLYKIPTIRAFIKGDKFLKKVSANDIAVGMKAFYQNPRHSIDMQDPSSEDYLNWSIEQYQKLAIKMPINFINKSSEYFNYDEINRELYISEDINKIASPLFIRHVEDILEYKLTDKCAKLYKKQEK